MSRSRRDSAASSDNQTEVRADVAQDKLARRLQATVEVDRPDQRLVAVGKQVARHDAAVVDVHAPAQEEVIVSRFCTI